MNVHSIGISLNKFAYNYLFDYVRRGAVRMTDSYTWQLLTILCYILWVGGAE